MRIYILYLFFNGNSSVLGGSCMSLTQLCWVYIYSVYIASTAGSLVRCRVCTTLHDTKL